MRFLRSFKYALEGIKKCIETEKNFRIQSGIAVITFVAGIIFTISVTEWFAVLFCTALVLSLEMVNTTFEKLADTITKSPNPLIKQVKDIAAGAVLLASVLSFITGCIIFIPKLKLLINAF